jgi:hypothetical protein
VSRIWIVTSLSMVLATATSIVTNLITDDGSWALGVLLIMLVVAAIAVAVLLFRTQNPAAGQQVEHAGAPSDARGQAGHHVNQQVFAIGEARVRQTSIIGVRDTVLAVTVMAVAAAIALIVAFLAYPARAQQRAETVLNPYNYLSTIRADPLLTQDCPGLFGLCVGVDSLERARETIDRPEIRTTGPKACETSTGTCQSWVLLNGLEVFVTVTDDDIVDIRLFIPEQTMVAVAYQGGIIELPATMDRVGAEITRGVGWPAFLLGELDGEGYWLERHAWHYLGSEGIVLADITISGQQQTPYQRGRRSAPFCDYSAAQRGTAQTYVESISVRTPPPDDPLNQDCPRSRGA